MADGRAESAARRPRPRPARSTFEKGSGAHAADQSAETDCCGAKRPTDVTTGREHPTGRPVLRSAPVRPAHSTGRTDRGGRGLARLDQQQSQQVASAAGTAIVTAARVGRLLGRSGWRIAKQLPGVDVVEQQAQKLRQVAAAEVFRMLEIPQGFLGSASPEEQRVMMLVQNAGTDAEPLRSAMTELLQRATAPDGGKNRDYLFGTIVSQLVPDEARILATLAAGPTFAVVDVVAKQIGRSATRTVLSDVSSVGPAAGVSSPANTPTYIARLRNFGLIDVGPASDDLVDQFVLLAEDPAVVAARSEIDKGKQGSSKIVRRTLHLSSFGVEFWAACSPGRAGIPRRST